MVMGTRAVSKARTRDADTEGPRRDPRAPVDSAEEAATRRPPPARFCFTGTLDTTSGERMHIRSEKNRPRGLYQGQGYRRHRARRGHTGTRDFHGSPRAGAGTGLRNTRG